MESQLRGKINDFAIYAHLINLSDTRKSNEKEQMVEEKYLKLEKWIFKNINNDKETDTTQTLPVVVADESMDF